ncbi:UDP-2,3-diacylglucosamine diphosphatase [Arcobacter sp. LA11]|uniref:UDP-2,3-diacylglucosamine diphosphatase n=1 Tax=Arcobacter sp. LA11 TaxID=1898176 RepID=UPI0009337A81|nr:metallophosphoesterase [Arcobacter sp. LA11]
MFLSIDHGAIFVADSHYNERRPEFLIFLKKLRNKEIKTTQLFLMGDMFDFISAESKYFIKRNQELIDIINELSHQIQIIYLEGNHDYNMDSLFQKVLVVKREKQPLNAQYNGKSVSLSHGDNFTPWHYNLYCKVIRNHALLVFLNLIDFNGFISKKIYYSLIKKNICSKMKDFDSFAKKRINNYKSDIIVEGHFHQGKEFSLNNQQYINIPSLFCDKKYIVLKEDFEGENL